MTTPGLAAPEHPLSVALRLVLDAAADAYTEAGLSTDDRPQRRYISPGEPPADCELLAVWAIPQIKPPVGNTAQTCNVIHQAEVRIRSWLCVPTGTPPNLGDLHTAGQRLHDHLWAVWSHLADLISHKALFEGMTSCAAAALISAEQLPEEGAYAGWEITLRLDLAPFATNPPAS